MNRYCSSIFCDDIRNEINGKISLMGVVGGTLFVQDFPFVAPRMCVLITVNTPVDSPFKKLRFKGDFEEINLFDVVAGEEEIQAMSRAAPDVHKQAAFSAQAMFIISPLAFEGPGTLKLSVQADGDDIYCPSLSVNKAPDGMMLL